MILKGSQRGGPRQLAIHLLNISDNDHVVVQEVRGFVSDDLSGAMTEAVATAKGTRCRQPVFSLSLNPPKEAEASVQLLMDAADRAGLALGLQDQPRAVVIHEKNGRRHAHVVWSRISYEEMKAINLPFFKMKLNELSKTLYLEHGWELPEGHKTNGWKNPLNFTLAEWQQAKRLDLDPREIKQIFHEAWTQSDNLASFKNALEEHGYYLAKGDKRALVATDLHGQIYSLSRWSGVKAKDLQQKLGRGDQLSSVSNVQASLRKQVSQKLRQHIVEDRHNKRDELKPLQTALKAIVSKQRVERASLGSKQQKRWNAESKERAGRFRRGLGVVVDVLSGRLFKLRKQNEAEAYAGFVRDKAQSELLYADQRQERYPHQQRIELVQERHKAERRLLAQRIASVLKLSREQHRERHRADKAPQVDFER